MRCFQCWMCILSHVRELQNGLFEIIRVTGKSPFWSKYPKETYHLNKSAAVVFEDPKVTALSTAGIDIIYVL